ncbi:hypothetical protein BC937DRAFT_86744 [Endogone sp. FLAS-F59071]|nr:hypothetical protein BC937DRAFT_86744 [Endogone sp. FLAS-F59071]|eukprot:RUS19899.1 hypothetical protein BC937DRAFT_86744 [Endogone sp. FLAS-F59071]
MSIVSLSRRFVVSTMMLLSGRKTTLWKTWPQTCRSRPRVSLYNNTLGVTEIKKEDIKKGIAQNALQLEACLLE